MTKRIIIRPKASQDLDDHFAYIAENNLEAALQLFDAARSTIAQLARILGVESFYLSKILPTRIMEWCSETRSPFPLRFVTNLSHISVKSLRLKYFECI